VSNIVFPHSGDKTRMFRAMPYVLGFIATKTPVVLIPEYGIDIRQV
jgi:hypothetical protein